MIAATAATHSPQKPSLSNNGALQFILLIVGSVSAMMAIQAANEIICCIIWPHPRNACAKD